MKVKVVSTKWKFGDRGVGIVQKYYGWRVLLWWWDVVISTTPANNAIAAERMTPAEREAALEHERNRKPRDVKYVR